MNIAYMMVIIATTDYIHLLRNCNATVNGSQTIKYCNKRFTENKTQSEWEQIHYIKRDASTSMACRLTTIEC